MNIKATTNERLGEIGGGEAIAALAVALLDEGVEYGARRHRWRVD